MALGSTWRFAGAAAQDAYDRLLESAAVQIADSIDRKNGQYSVSPPDSVFDTINLAENDRFFYSARAPNGTLLTGYSDLPAASGRLNGQGVARADISFAGAPIRLVTLHHYFGPGEGSGWTSVTVGQTLAARRAMQLSLFYENAPILLIIGVLGLFASLLGVKLAVRPLSHLEEALARRDPHDLTPISNNGPAETRALVEAINDLMLRLEQRLNHLQQFAGLAAHQLRTPLTALASQVDLLAFDSESTSRAARIERLRIRIQELNRLLHQLLGHAMAAYRGKEVPREPVDLVSLSRTVALGDHLHSMKPELEIEFEATEDAMFVMGDAVMLREAIANLVNNAAIHGAHHRIRVRVDRSGNHVKVVVADDGSGLSPQEWELASTPFSLKRQDSAGAGLGLTIVRETAESHGARLYFTHDEAGMFEVTMQFEEATVP